MLEKIGLPAKPSLRGNNWVIDASHCQGCCSQFTMFNRKHHCRRCGGLFCNNCTQQRMYLRGQGDSHVRICDPCKKLEEAARLEARHKNRAAKGDSRPATKPEDELDLILGTDGKQSLSSGQGSVEDTISDFLAAGTSSFTKKSDTTQQREVDVPGSSSADVFASSMDEMESSSPEDLLKRAQEEKKKYSILKREGKSDEALRAFKRGKELERHSASLELALRKSRKNPSSALSSLSSVKANGQPLSSARKTKGDKQGKETRDLTSELKDLGWSEADLHDVDRKPFATTLEDEMINILGNVPQKSTLSKGTNDVDKSRVVALRRNALNLKREGRLSEAKEELKKAKILEKELEEKELLADDDESDDEIAALVRGMDDDNQEDTAIDFASDVGLNLNNITDLSDEIVIDGNFDVTDDDMNDPEIAAALRSFGWVEETAVSSSSSVNHEALRNEVLSLKREAVKLKREGNVAAAMEQLKKAKLLEKDLLDFESEGNSNNQRDATTLISSADNQELKVCAEDIKTTRDLGSTRQSKGKSEIQKELLGLKRKALALRREGRVDEAEEELKKCKALEIQLDEVENTPKMLTTAGKGLGFDDKLHGVSRTSVLREEEMEEVSEKDMHDPSLLSVLHTLGWKDEDDQCASGPLESSKKMYCPVVLENPTSELKVKVSRSRSEIQKELLGIKRRSLALRRQGKLEEAEEELKKAKVLEAQMEEIDASQVDSKVSLEDPESRHLKESDIGPLDVTKLQQGDGKIGKESSSFPAISSLSSKNVGSGDDLVSVMGAKVQRSRAEIQKELLGIKRRSLAWRRQGKIEEAEEELKKAKILEAQIEVIDLSEPNHAFDSKAGFDDELRHLGLESSDVTKRKQGAGILAEETRCFPAMQSSPESVDLEDAPEIIDALKGSGLTKGNLAGRPERKLETAVPVTSQSGQSVSQSTAKLDESFDLLHKENGSMPFLDLPQAAKLSYLPDLLTGEGWVDSHLSNSNENLVTSISGGRISSVPLLQIPESDAIKEKTAKPVRLFGASIVDVAKKQEKISGTFQSIAGEPDVSDKSVQKHTDRVVSQQEILAHKRKAVALKREGKLAEAREELRQAKILEKALEDGGEDNVGNTSASPSDPRSKHTQAISGRQTVSLPLDSASSDISRSPESKLQGQAPKPVSARDRFKLQQESLAHKRQALRLRREGRVEESEKELELAKALESQLEESTNSQTSAGGAEATDDVFVEDLVDPQLFSALQAIGMQGLELPTPGQQRHDAKGKVSSQQTGSNVSSSKSASREIAQLEEQIKAEKVQALDFKRAGKQAEAMDALRRAKLLEKRLNSLSS